NAVDGQDMADVDASAAAIASATALALKSDRFAGADGSIANSMRPHVIGLEQETPREAALQGCLQRVEVILAGAGLEPEGAESRQRALGGRRVDQVDRVLAEQMMTFASDIGDLPDEVLP